MTALEQITLTDGFRLALLGVHVRPRLAGIACHGILFDGGRRQSVVHYVSTEPAPPPAFWEDLRRILLAVAAPPHVLVVHDTGWRELLRQALPDYVRADLRILELLPTAIRLTGTLPTRASIDAIRTAYGLSPAPDVEDPASPAYEDLLWAVLAAAGQRGMDWPALLAADRAGIVQPLYERYAFDETALAAVPPVPGVYVMRDAAGAVLYVGKSANLARRLRDYFRPARELSPKLMIIRDRIRAFEIHPVGSELEALLLENRLIGEWPAGMNVQRAVAEGASRYAFPLLPVLLICRSARPGAGELFACGAGCRALQGRVMLARPAPRRLLQLAQQAPLSHGAPLRDLVDWGQDGNEICCRYFARSKDRLNWLEINLAPSPARFVAAVRGILDRIATRDPEPAEFRLADAE